MDLTKVISASTLDMMHKLTQSDESKAREKANIAKFINDHEALYNRISQYMGKNDNVA